MDLIDKYLGEGRPYGNAPSLDSLKYNPAGKYLTADELEDVAKIAKGKSGEITANIAWAMKKNDKKKVKMLIDKFGQHVIGMDSVMNWLKGK